MSNDSFKHEPIRIYNPKQTLAYLPWVHIMIGNIKGIIKGVHHVVNAKHLVRYLSEYCYRFNRRLIGNNKFINLIGDCTNTQTIIFAELKT